MGGGGGQKCRRKRDVLFERCLREKSIKSRHTEQPVELAVS